MKRAWHNDETTEFLFTDVSGLTPHVLPGAPLLPRTSAATFRAVTYLLLTRHQLQENRTPGDISPAS